MLCDSCADHQEYLLESGDGSQVICEHQLKIIEEIGASTSELLLSLSTNDVDRSSNAVAATAADTVSGKRKFVSADRFAKLTDTKLRRKISPIKKWRELPDRISHRVVKIHSMEVAISKGKKIEKKKSFYAELKTEEGEMINVWLTDIIHNELSTHNLDEGNVYIMPLGKATSKSTGHEYYNFAIVQDD